MAAASFSIYPDSTDGCRQHRRLEVQFSAILQIEDEQEVAQVTELSPRGVRVQHFRRLRPGEQVLLRRHGIEARCGVAWINGATAGLLFLEPLQEAALLQFKRHALPEAVPQN